MLSQAQLENLMSMIRRDFLLTDTCEITIEANPENLDESKAAIIKAIGINRISLGVQSLNEGYLSFLGRKHTAAQARDAYYILRKQGFTNINLDLMYAFPGQTAAELEEDVRAIASLGSQHLSLYTLTIEPHSKFYANALKLDDEEKIAQGYLMVKEILAQHGFEQYEISNFSKPGFQSSHNRNYWLGGRYIGLGMGAHGFMDNRRYWNKAKLQEYLNSPDAMEGFEDLDEHTLAMEKLLFGLRMNEGIDAGVLPLEKKKTVEDLVREGYLTLDAQRLKATTQGQLVLDELSVRLI